MADFVVIGQDKVIEHLNKVGNAPEFFDSTVAKVARSNLRKLIKTTNKMTGNTARGWTTPKRLGLSRYFVENKIVSSDKKHLIVNILDLGRGKVRPVRAKRLYIPLTNKGRSKKLGAKIPGGLIYGVDYVLAKKAKAFKGTKFKQIAIKNASIDLEKKALLKIKEVYR